MTENGGPAWRQTIYYPFLHASLYGRGVVLEGLTRSPAYENKLFGSVPFLDAAATFDEERRSLVVFAANRSWEDSLTLETDLRSFVGYEVLEHIVLEHEDPKATNTRERPQNVVPHTLSGAKVVDGKLTTVLPKLSWNVIRLEGHD